MRLSQLRPPHAHHLRHPKFKPARCRFSHQLCTDTACPCRAPRALLSFGRELAPSDTRTAETYNNSYPSSATRVRFLAFALHSTAPNNTASSEGRLKWFVRLAKSKSLLASRGRGLDTAGGLRKYLGEEPKSPVVKQGLIGAD
eukprot:1197209-Pyramimonas_sp.AAC.1